MRDESDSNRQTGDMGSPSLRELAAIFFRQRQLIAIVFFAVLGAVLLYGWLSPSYQAHMKILVGKGRIDPVVSPGPTQTLQLAAPQVSEEELNSEAELLQDAQMLHAVVKSIALDAEVSLPFWQVGSENKNDLKVERAVQQLRRHLKVEPVKKTTLIEVTY